jgi:hypothetical protein
MLAFPFFFFISQKEKLGARQAAGAFAAATS